MPFLLLSQASFLSEHIIIVSIDAFFFIKILSVVLWLSSVISQNLFHDTQPQNGYILCAQLVLSENDKALLKKKVKTDFIKTITYLYCRREKYV